MSAPILTKAVFKAAKTAIHEVNDSRNQSYQAEQRAREFYNSHLEQQSIMPNFSRPYQPGDKGQAAHTPPPSIAKSIANSFLRLCQFAFALTVAGLYGRDLHHACDKNVYLDAKWVFAEIVAALAAATSAAYLLIWCCVGRIARPALTSYYSMHFPLWLWEMFMCLIWLTLFGIFGKLYLPENPEGDLDIVRMKHAVWVDLVNLLLWTATMIWSGLRWVQGRVRKDKEGESGKGDVGDASERMKEFNFNDGAGAGAGAGGHATPAASGVVPVAASPAPIAMPTPTPCETPRSTPRSTSTNAPQHDVSPTVSRQNSSANANANASTEDRTVSPL